MTVPGGGVCFECGERGPEQMFNRVDVSKSMILWAYDQDPAASFLSTQDCFGGSFVLQLLWREKMPLFLVEATYQF